MRLKNLAKFFVLLFIFVLSVTTLAAQQRTTGGVRGRVRVESGSGAAGVTVAARQGEQEIGSTTTNGRGDFTLSNLAPGTYSLVFRRPGLRVGTLNNIVVQAGELHRLNEQLFLPVDEGSLALVRGSVFTAEGRSLRGARVEIARVGADGSVRRIDYRMTNEMGVFAFRLPPDDAIYRVTATLRGAQPATNDVQVQGAAIYRLALTLAPAAR